MMQIPWGAKYFRHELSLAKANHIWQWWELNRSCKHNKNQGTSSMDYDQLKQTLYDNDKSLTDHTNTIGARHFRHGIIIS